MFGRGLLRFRHLDFRSFNNRRYFLCPPRSCRCAFGRCCFPSRPTRRSHFPGRSLSRCRLCDRTPLRRGFCARACCSSAGLGLCGCTTRYAHRGFGGNFPPCCGGLCRSGALGRRFTGCSFGRRTRGFACAGTCPCARRRSSLSGSGRACSAAALGSSFGRTPCGTADCHSLSARLFHSGFLFTHAKTSFSSIFGRCIAATIFGIRHWYGETRSELRRHNAASPLRHLFADVFAGTCSRPAAGLRSGKPRLSPYVAVRWHVFAYPHLYLRLAADPFMAACSRARHIFCSSLPAKPRVCRANTLSAGDARCESHARTSTLLFCFLLTNVNKKQPSLQNFFARCIVMSPATASRRNESICARLHRDQKIPALPCVRDPLGQE